MQAKSGKAGKRYIGMQKRAQVLWPLRSQIPFVREYTDHVIRYYKSLEHCDIEQAISLILLLEKKH